MSLTTEQLHDIIIKDPWAETYTKYIIRGSDRAYPEFLPRLKSKGPAMTMRGFCGLLWQSLKILRPDLKFYPGYPDYILDREGANAGPAPVAPDETITWSIIRQTPGSVGSQPFSARREIKPRLRDIIEIEGQTESTQNGGGLCEIYGQWMDNLIQFDIWTKDNSSAEDLVEWYKTFMMEYEGIWLERGINKLLFWERLRDETITKWRNGLVNRSLRWFVRTEELYVREVPKIKEIDISLKRLEEHLIKHWEAAVNSPNNNS